MNFSVNNKSSVSILACLMVVGASSICEAAMPNPLHLTISIDKNNLAVGATVRIDFVLKNTGDSDLSVVGRGLYESDWIKVFDPQARPMSSHKKIELSVRWPNDSEVLILRKGETSKKVFIGTIRKDQVMVVNKLVEQHGLFLDFQNSSIQLEGPGTYTIKANYQSDDLWGKQAKNRFKNIWGGELVSNAVKFHLKN